MLVCHQHSNHSRLFWRKAKWSQTAAAVSGAEWLLQSLSAEAIESTPDPSWIQIQAN